MSDNNDPILSGIFTVVLILLVGALGLVAALIVAMMVSSPAEAQQSNCSTRPLIEQKLASEYGEQRLTYGIAANGALVETWANTDTGTWSITYTSPLGLSCFAATGQGFTVDQALLINTDDPI